MLSEKRIIIKLSLMCQALFCGRIYDNKTEVRNYIKKNYYAVICEEENLCPDCNQKMKVRDSRKRTVMDESGEKYEFRLRRFKCDTCNNIHLELPDCLIPYKRYSKHTIDIVLNGECDYYSIDQSTVYRWTHLFCNDEKTLE